MAKKKTLFECQACGFQSPRWMGKCTSCNEWESMIELSTEQIKFLKDSSSHSSVKSARSKAKPITQIEEDNITRFHFRQYRVRLSTWWGYRAWFTHTYRRKSQG